MVEARQNLGNQNLVIENWRSIEDINPIDEHRNGFLGIRDGPPQ